MNPPYAYQFPVGFERVLTDMARVEDIDVEFL